MEDLINVENPQGEVNPQEGNELDAQLQQQQQADPQLEQLAAPYQGEHVETNDQAPHNEPNMPADDRVQGSQLGSIEKFDPQKEGSDIEAWCAGVDTAKATFGWSDTQTATAAMSRLTGSAAQWLLNESGEGNDYTNWTDAPAADAEANPPRLNLRPALLVRFKIQLTYQNAATLMSDLHQKSGETVSTYYDRVRSAIIVKNKVVFTDQQRGEGWYNGVLKNDYKTFFLAGLKPDIKSRLPQPYPDTIGELLAIAVGVEAEARKTKFTIDEVEADLPAEGKPKTEEKDLSDLIKDLSQEVAALKIQKGTRRPFDNKNIVCWGCGKTGHIRQHCFASQRDRNKKGRFISGKRPAPGRQQKKRFRPSINELSGNEYREW